MRLFCFSCLLFLLFACTKEINIELPKQEPKIVVNSLFTNKEPFQVYLTKTRTPFETKEFFIDNAKVIIYSGNIADTLQYTGDGIYTSSVLGLANSEYRIDVISNGFDKVTSKDYIPKQIEQPMISGFRDSVGVDEEGYYYSQFTIAFKDDASERNFYEISIKDLVFGDETWVKPCFSNDPIIVAEGLNDYYPKTIVFSDAFFNGKEKELAINYYPVAYGKPSGGSGELVDANYKVIVRFKNISENYYKYKKKLEVHLSGQDFDFWEGSGDPVQMFSNITDGYCIFAGYTEIVDTIQKLKK